MIWYIIGAVVLVLAAGVAIYKCLKKKQKGMVDLSKLHPHILGKMRDGMLFV